MEMGLASGREAASCEAADRGSCPGLVPHLLPSTLATWISSPAPSHALVHHQRQVGSQSSSGQENTALWRGRKGNKVRGTREALTPSKGKI